MEESGFLELEHTADWALRVWGPDFETLLTEAGRGMFHLMEMQPGEGEKQVHVLTIEADDREAMLVLFLSELLYLSEREGLVFDPIELFVEGRVLQARAEGHPFVSQRKEIKAVTYHNLSVEDTEHGVEAVVVFDV